MNVKKPFIVGIAGGTGAGKTTLARDISTALGSRRVVLLDADSYYRDRSHIRPDKRHDFNFDHPDALDTDLLVRHIRALKQAASIEKPLYDFAAHTRMKETLTIAPLPVIVLDGLLVLAIEPVCALCDLRVFIDVDADVRLVRRMLRDVQQRGRTPEWVARQYLATVRPMHRRFVEPSKSRADIVVTNEHTAQTVLAAVRREIV